MSVLRSDSIKVSTRLLREATEVVDRSGLPDWCAARFAQSLGQYRGGASAQFGWRPLLVGLALVALSEQPMFLRDVVRTLNALNPNQKRAIGCPTEVSERMVSRRWNQLAHLVDASRTSERNRSLRQHLTDEQWIELAAWREAGLQHLLTVLLAGSIPDDQQASGSLAIDATGVPSWASQRRKHTNTDTSSDPDGAWRVHDSTRVPYGNTANRRRFGAKAWYGYWMHSLVRIPNMKVRKTGDIEFSDTPLFIEALDVTSAGADMAVAGADLLDRHTHRQRLLATQGHDVPEPGDIVMDRAYSQGYERFLEPARAAGYTPHFDLRSDQRGLGGSVDGMVIVDGQPYSPAMPSALYAITPPRIPGATRAEIDAWGRQVAARRPYAIKIRSIGADGAFGMSCPAARDFTAARCSRKPDSVLLPATIPTFAPPQTVNPPKICAQQKLRVEAEDLPLWQPYPYGSPEWWASMGRRARVEGSFGCLKDEATQDISRGRIRVMGRAKTALMAVFLAAAVNIRLARKLRNAAEAGQGAPTRRRPRGPRARTRRLAAVREQRAAHAAEQSALADTG